MFNSFTVGFLDDAGSLATPMPAIDILDNMSDAPTVIDFFSDQMSRNPEGFTDLNLRIAEYPPVTVSWHPIGTSAAGAEVAAEGSRGDFLLLLSRRDVADEAQSLTAFQSTMKDVYEPDVVEQMLGDVRALRRPIVLVGRTSNGLSPRVEVTMDRTIACLAAAFFARGL